MRDRCVDRETLSWYLENDLFVEDLQAVGEHLARCEQCAGELDEMIEMDAWIAETIPVRLPAGLASRASAAPHGRGAEKSRPRTARPGWIAAGRVATVGLAASVAAFVFWPETVDDAPPDAVSSASGDSAVEAGSGEVLTIGSQPSSPAEISISSDPVFAPAEFTRWRARPEQWGTLRPRVVEMTEASTGVQVVQDHEDVMILMVPDAEESGFAERLEGLGFDRPESPVPAGGERFVILDGRAESTGTFSRLGGSQGTELDDRSVASREAVAAP